MSYRRFLKPSYVSPLNSREALLQAGASILKSDNILKGDNLQFSIPLPTDEDGLLGRECSGLGCALKYFKIQVPDEDNTKEDSFSRSELTCPYCAHVDSFQEFHTKSQIDYAHSLAHREVEQALVKSLQEAVRPLNNMRGGLISIKATVTATLPPIKRYVEEKLTQTSTCDQCGHQYAVYGLSYRCPVCAKGTLGMHIRQSLATVRVLAGEADAIGEKYGRDALDKMLGDAYENVVSAFEGFLKVIYANGVSQQLTAAVAERLVKQVRTSFQRLDESEALFRREFGVELFYCISAAERERLAVVFCKRHVLAHCLGIVDDRYRTKVKAWEKPGQEVPLDATEVICAAVMVEMVLTQAALALT